MVPRPLPSEMVFMLMLVNMKVKIDELEKGGESSWREK
jgi:hypothetical protein